MEVVSFPQKIQKEIVPVVSTNVGIGHRNGC